MNVFIRVDSSTQMGTGHLMRCLTLADELREHSAKVSFICRELPGNLSDFIEKKGHKVYRLPYTESLLTGGNQHTHHAAWLGIRWKADAEQAKAILSKETCIDWLIVDHYALDKQWEKQVRPLVKKIMVIDDLADRSHDCDLLLDQNFYDNLEFRYDGLVPDYCQKLLGPRYVLLRPEFRKARKKLRERDGHIRHILIFFGGSDPANETAKALKATSLLSRPDITVDVVVGGANPNKEKIKQLCSTIPNVSFHCQTENMARLMVKADLAIGAGGSTMWERCFLGLPSITLVVAQNQAEIAAAVAAAGATRNLGCSNDVSEENLANEILKAMDDPEAMKEMAKMALKLVDNESDESKSAVLQAIMKNVMPRHEGYLPRREDYRLRPMEEADLEKVLEWRNSKRIRINMFTDHIITMDEHQAWFNRVKQSQSAIHKIFQFQGCPVGMVSFTNIDRHNNRCYWGFYLGEEALPRRTGLVMGFLGVKYAFEELGIRKLCGEVFAFNTSSIGFHKKLGFSEEGRFAQHILKNGNYEDIIAFALFKEDWLRKGFEMEKELFLVC